MKKIIPRRKIKLSGTDIYEAVKYLYCEKACGESAIKIFEDTMKSYIGAGYARVISSGRQALRLILESLELDKGDEIILPAYTLAALPLMIKKMGLVPVFVDVEPMTMNMDPLLIKDKITKKTKAIIATHIFGVPCAIHDILDIANDNNIAVIEDCAHALGAYSRTRHVGTFGRAGFFSFSHGKQINTFGGGLVVSDDAEIIGAVSEKTSGGRVHRTKLLASLLMAYAENMLVESYFSVLFFMSRRFLRVLLGIYSGLKNKVRGSDEHFSAFQAHIGMKQMEKIEEEISLCTQNAEHLRQRLGDIVSFQDSNAEDLRVYYTLVARIRSIRPLKELADAFARSYIDVGIESEIMDQCPMVMGESMDNYPVTSALAKSAIQFPIHHSFSARELQMITDTVARILNVMEG